jgi:hypothetical protein
MRKHILYSVIVLVIAALAAWNVNVNLHSRSSNLSGISLANVDALAYGEDDNNTGGNNPTICYKIKSSCSCYYTNGTKKTWCCMSITECESYTLVPPLQCHNCITTSCSGSSSCY